MASKVADPVDPSRLGVAVVCDIIDMPLFSSKQTVSRSSGIPRKGKTQLAIVRALHYIGGRVHTKLSISPQATFWLSMPRRPPLVRKPSLPAKSSLHSVARARSTVAARDTCCGEQPKMMHFPNRVRRSGIQRCGGGGGMLGPGTVGMEYWRQLLRGVDTRIEEGRNARSLSRDRAAIVANCWTGSIAISQLQFHKKQLHP